LVPEVDPAAKSKEGALAGQLIQEVRDAFGGDSARLTHALKVYHYSKQFVAKEGGNPRVTLAAALLLGVDASGSEVQGMDRASSRSRAEEILGRLGADEDTINKVRTLLNTHASQGDLDWTEYRVIRDADTLAELTAEGPGDSPQKLATIIDKRLDTGSAKDMARKLFRVSSATGDE
jgi:hypothetical protein